MNITYACPACGEAVRANFTAGDQVLCCTHCDGRLSIPAKAVDGNQVRRCLVCPSADLYVRKDFPQRIGVGLVAVGIVGSSIAWAYANVLATFGILFATALADLALFAVVGNCLMCYRCHAQYRGVEQMDVHGAFDLETHERYRQMAARMNEKSEVGGQRPEKVVE